jgi:hypothetical protein
MLLLKHIVHLRNQIVLFIRCNGIFLARIFNFRDQLQELLRRFLCYNVGLGNISGFVHCDTKKKKNAFKD